MLRIVRLVTFVASVSILASAAMAKEIWVNCNRGESIEDALSVHASEPKLIINLSGRCWYSSYGYINVLHPDVTIQSSAASGSYGARIELLFQVYGSLTLKRVAVVTTNWVGAQALRGARLVIEDSSVRGSFAGIFVATGSKASITRSILQGSQHGLFAYQGIVDLVDSTARSGARNDTPDGDGLYGAAISAFDNSSISIRNSKLVNTNASEGVANPRHAVQVFDQSRISIDGGETRGEVRVSGQSAGFFYATKMVGRLRTEGTSIVSVVGPASQQGAVVSDTNSIIAIGPAPDPLRGRAECLNGGRIVGKVDGLTVVGCL